MDLYPHRTFLCRCLVVALLVLLALILRQLVVSHHLTAQALKPLAPSSHQVPVQKTHSYYIALARQDAQAAGISTSIFIRQITEESNFNPHAVSPAGAIGIAQFMPKTAAGLGLNPRDPEASLKAAAQLMRRYLDIYHGSYAMALAAYNAGPGGLAAARRCGANWIACLPSETRAYIAIILDQAMTMASPGGMQ